MLPTNAEARKAIPVYRGFVVYFPHGMAAVAELSLIANEQHNPGEPLHWAKEKSQDELDALMRHTLDFAIDPEHRDPDGVHPAVKRAWRAMADLERLHDAGVNIFAVGMAEPPEGYTRLKLDPLEGPMEAIDRISAPHSSTATEIRMSSNDRMLNPTRLDVMLGEAHAPTMEETIDMEKGSAPVGAWSVVYTEFAEDGRIKSTHQRGPFNLKEATAYQIENPEELIGISRITR